MLMPLALYYALPQAPYYSLLIATIENKISRNLILPITLMPVA
jgi:hypothetical protein